jgi:hypothetical protein
VLSINRQLPTATTTNANAVTFRAIFSEKVTGVDAPDFTAVVSGSLTATVSGVTPVGTDGSTYDVTVSAISGNGTLRLDLKSSSTGISDVATNSINSGYTTGQTYTIQQTVTQGFTSVTNLNPVDISKHTGEKPQFKVWQHAGKHWAVLATAEGTKIFRLDGTSWTAVLTLASSTNPKCDVRVMGDVTHILLFRGASGNSYVVSVEYDAALNTYKFWSQRPSKVTIIFEPGTEIATLEMDGTGRMWVASDGVGEVNLRWSDSPYANWSAPITIASGATDDDICSLRALKGGKIGVLWSNQNSQRFGFKTHTDGSVPSVWSADEVPASQSAVNNVGLGFSDDHMNMTLASDGTLYCAVKTSYETAGYPKLILLVRRPAGTWDNLYPITTTEGTRPIVLLNEAIGKLKVVYTSVENGGDILYRESSTASISFGSPITLITGKYNYVTSTHQTYNPDIALLATDVSSTSLKAVGFLGTDGAAPLTSTRNQETADLMAKPVVQPVLQAYPNPFTHKATLQFTLPADSEFSLTLFDAKGARISLLQQGKALARQLQTVEVEANHLNRGLYFVRLQTNRGTQTLRLMLDR